jgi:hypothetical protein
VADADSVLGRVAPLWRRMLAGVLRAGLGPVTLRSALVRHQAGMVWQQLTRPLRALGWRANAGRMEGIRAELEAVRRAHPGDSKARQEAMLAAYREHNVSCLTPVIWSVGPAVPPQLPALFTQRRQTAFQKLAGIAVVYERRQPR